MFVQGLGGKQSTRRKQPTYHKSLICLCKMFVKGNQISQTLKNGDEPVVKVHFFDYFFFFKADCWEYKAFWENSTEDTKT
jgi:hypothetical protein